MKEKRKTVHEINERIEDGSVRVVTASEMTEIVADLGPEGAMHEVDVVTTGTFGAMCSSGMWMNFGHCEPPMKMSKVWLNDVEAYAGVAAVDAYLGATQPSESLGIEYGGGHVIEDLIRRKPIHLRAEAYGTDCYPRKELSTEINLDDLNQAVLSNPRNCYERYAVATNSTERTLYTYMGKLLPDFGNATFSAAGELSPITNDPTYRTIGIGTRIFLGGTEGYVVGSGTQHSPTTGFGTLMLHGDLKQMSPKFIRGASLARYGSTLYVGVGVPIPVLDADIARTTGISDEYIVTNVFDYSIPTRSRPSLRKVNYAELKSGAIEINGREVKTAPLSSDSVARTIAELLKKEIATGKFLLSDSVKPLSSDSIFHPLEHKASPEHRDLLAASGVPKGQLVFRDISQCVQCGVCITVCPAEVFTWNSDRTITDVPENCVGCGECSDVCPVRAIAFSG